MQVRSRIVAREFESDDRPDPFAGTLPLEALKCIISIAAIHRKTFSIMHVDVSRAHFHAKKAQGFVLVRVREKDSMGVENRCRCWKVWASASVVVDYGMVSLMVEQKAPRSVS